MALLDEVIPEEQSSNINTALLKVLGLSDDVTKVVLNKQNNQNNNEKAASEDAANSRLEKVAMNAWKRNFGDLSNEARTMLRGKYFDFDKYTNGLNRGTDNILKSRNAGEKIEEFVNPKSNTRDIRNTIYKARTEVNLSSDDGGIVRGGRVKYTISTPKMYGNESEEDKFVHAVFRRHEADEVRAAHKKLTKVYKDVENTPISWADSRMQEFHADKSNNTNKNFTHKDNFVTWEEGKNISLAPDSTRTYFKGKRMDGKKELPILNVDGIEVGKTQPERYTKYNPDRKMFNQYGESLTAEEDYKYRKMKENGEQIRSTRKELFSDINTQTLKGKYRKDGKFDPKVEVQEAHSDTNIFPTQTTETIPHGNHRLRNIVLGTTLTGAALGGTSYTVSTVRGNKYEQSKR